MGVRGGADQADTTKPFIATDPQTSGPFDTEEVAVTKLVTGAAGTSALVSAANGLPVTLDAASLAALESITAIISGAIALDAPTLAALETIGLDAATLAALESITIGTALPAGNNNIGDVDVASLPSLPAGSAAIGKLAANSGVDIGDVDVTSLPALPAGANVIGNVGHDNTGVGSGRKIVTTAGTRVALASSTPAKSVVITAETDNTGIVVVGSAAGVIAALATREGTPLSAGDTIVLPIDNLADVGLDSMVSGDGVSYTYTS